MLHRLFWIFAFIFPLIHAHSQLPSSDVYVFKYTLEGDSMRLYDAKFLTEFNMGSYNNQPSFFSYSDLYLTCYNQEQEQTDIIHLDLSTNKLYEVTNTVESEYSPILMPGKKFFSCIKVLKDENNSQLLWQYPVNQTNGGKAIFKGIKNVGYHLWLNRQKVAMFLVDEPHKLAIADTESKDKRLILENIGRTFKLNKNGKLLFIHKISETLFYIKEYDPILNRATIITSTLGGIEDFDLLDDGSLIMGKGSDLYRFMPGISSVWEKIANLDKFHISDIGRISSYNDRIVLVSRN